MKWGKILFATGDKSEWIIFYSDMYKKFISLDSSLSTYYNAADPASSNPAKVLCEGCVIPWYDSSVGNMGALTDPAEQPK